MLASAFQREVNASNNSANAPRQASAPQKGILLCHINVHLCSVRKSSTPTVMVVIYVTLSEQERDP